MELSSLNPFVRYARRQDQFPIRSGMTAYDHRFFYCIDGIVEIEINDRRYRMEKDSVILWSAGMPYRYILGESAVLLGFNFDLTQASAEQSVPIPPDLLENYHAEKRTEQVRLSDFFSVDNVIFLSGMHPLRAGFLEIEEEYNGRKLFWERRCSVLLSDLLIRLTRELLLPLPKNGDRINRILEYIQKNYALPLSNRQLGTIFRYHPNYINRMIVQQTGVSLHSYLINCRIHAAIRLLETTELSIGTIAETVGFGELAHFSKCFRQRTGQSPSAFRI